jgi:2-polyprenyl-3-methyl-5-hydroxy-6-metoxy-1,4-benzoquinol methylase
LCSHCIEHLEDPVKFVKQLKKVSKYFSLVTCPFNEMKPLAEGHEVVISKEIIDLCEPKETYYYKSINRWREDLEMVVFIV